MPLDGADASVTTILGGVIELQWRLGGRICKGAHYPSGVSTEPVAELPSVWLVACQQLVTFGIISY